MLSCTASLHIQLPLAILCTLAAAVTLSPKYNTIVMYQNSLDENNQNSESLGTLSPCQSLLLNALDHMDADQIDLEEDKLYGESEPEAPPRIPSPLGCSNPHPPIMIQTRQGRTFPT